MPFGDASISVEESVEGISRKHLQLSISSCQVAAEELDEVPGKRHDDLESHGRFVNSPVVEPCTEARVEGQEGNSFGLLPFNLHGLMICIREQSSQPGRLRGLSRCGVAESRSASTSTPSRGRAMPTTPRDKVDQAAPPG